MWIEENARQLVAKLAAIPLWRDTYPDSQFDRVLGRKAADVFTPEDVRLARALLEAR